MTTICHACDKPTNPFVEMDRGGAVRRCGNPECRAILKPQAAPVKIAAPAVVDVQEAAPKAKPVTVAVQAVPSAATSAPATASALVVAMRERLAVVKARLGELAVLTDEEAALERMLAAAEPPPN